MEFSGKVAVVTGAGSGIGRGLAGKAAQLGMKVVACDVDTKGLKATEESLSQGGAEVLAQVTDVTDYGAVVRLADAAYNRFGRVNLLFNNAGVLVDGILWERSLEDWRWNLDVNVMGVIHGIKAFVPRMIAGGEEGIVVNTASVGGLTAGPFQGPYITSKYAVVDSPKSCRLNSRCCIRNCAPHACVPARSRRKSSAPSASGPTSSAPKRDHHSRWTPSFTTGSPTWSRAPASHPANWPSGCLRR